MLILLMPEQIAANWDFIRQQLVHSTPLELVSTETHQNGVLNALLIGDMQCWVEATLDDKGFHIQAILITQILDNVIVGVKNLLLYSFMGVEDMFHLDTWNRGLLTITQYARKHGCSNIIAYSDNPRILRMAERFKANTSQRLIVFSLN